MYCLSHLSFLYLSLSGLILLGNLAQTPTTLPAVVMGTAPVSGASQLSLLGSVRMDEAMEASLDLGSAPLPAMAVRFVVLC